MSSHTLIQDSSECVNSEFGCILSIDLNKIRFISFILIEKKQQ